MCYRNYTDRWHYAWCSNSTYRNAKAADNGWAQPSPSFLPSIKSIYMSYCFKKVASIIKDSHHRALCWVCHCTNGWRLELPILGTTTFLQLSESWINRHNPNPTSKTELCGPPFAFLWRANGPVPVCTVLLWIRSLSNFVFALMSWFILQSYFW